MTDTRPSLCELAMAISHIDVGDREQSLRVGGRVDAWRWPRVDAVPQPCLLQHSASSHASMESSVAAPCCMQHANRTACTTHRASCMLMDMQDIQHTASPLAPCYR